MIKAIVTNLEKGKFLLLNITDEAYVDSSIGPYHASIGIHIRHIMDVFDCVFKGIENGKIDLTARKRNNSVEENKELGLAYIESIIEELTKLDPNLFQKQIPVADNLGNGVFEADYTIAAILIQAHSHATHHYASIGYILHQLEIELKDDSFGFNPTTPKKEISVKN